jgi:hypothetical protein
MRKALILLALAGVAAAPADNWQITDKTSELDGKRTYIAVVQSNEAIANIIDSEEKASFGAVCDKNGFTALVHWPDFVSKAYDEYSVPIAWKVDDKPVVKARWDATDQSVSLSGQKAMKWLIGLKDAKKLVVSVPDKHGGQEVAFDLDGIDRVLDQVSKLRCG